MQDYQLQEAVLTANKLPASGIPLGNINARDIVVDYRPGVGIRVAPHVYNTIEGTIASGACAKGSSSMPDGRSRP